MSTVPFHDICDAPGCGRATEEYSRLPLCDSCTGHVCPEHTARVIREWDVDTAAKVVCVACAAEAEA